MSRRDLDFLIENAAPDYKDKAKLKQLILEDDDFRTGLVGDDKVFQRVISDQEVLIKISPALYFEVLLSRALKDLAQAGHTVERTGSQTIPVFDARRVVDLLAKQSVLHYLAQMLSSFARIESYSIAIPVRKGVWRRIRFNDMDIDDLTRMAESVDEEQKFNYYKRIADVCLFILGMFPEYAHFNYSYPAKGAQRARAGRRARRGIEDYEVEGRRFYRLAAEHRASHDLRLTEVFWLLHDNFNAAKKPMNFISEHYIHFAKHQLFGKSAKDQPD